MKNSWKEVEAVKGSDENVLKFIFKKDDAIAEAVLYKYPTYQDRTVMCVSTQSGCNMGCTFCGTGKFFNRDLTNIEILEQIFYMEDYAGIQLSNCDKVQLMFMSMGEPLLNMGNMTDTLISLYALYPEAQLLISTSAPKTKYGWEEFMIAAETIPAIGLQFSVHESTDEARNKLMPIKAKLSLEEISEKGGEFYLRTGRRPFFNYCVHEGNNTEDDVQRLYNLFNPSIWECTLSVIYEADESMSEAVQDAVDIVNEFSGRMVGEGFNTRVFNPAGQDDIGGGCGQLWQVQKFAEEHPELMKQSAGNRIHVKNIGE